MTTVLGNFIVPSLKTSGVHLSKSVIYTLLGMWQISYLKSCNIFWAADIFSWAYN